MTNDIPAGLDGVWRNEKYEITIQGERITIAFEEEIVCDSTFRIEGKWLKNLKKREDWQAYVVEHQYEVFGHFFEMEFADGVLIGYVLVHDLGVIRLPFAKDGQEGLLPTFDQLLSAAAAENRHRVPMMRRMPPPPQ